MSDTNQPNHGISTQNDRGEWVPAIPEPYFLAFGRVKCRCGGKFRGRRRYREHFALTHILRAGQVSDHRTAATDDTPGGDK